jgi:hypothetical protein
MKVKMMKTETMLLMALLVAVGYFMWMNNGTIRRSLGIAPKKEGMYSWNYINGKEGYEGANVGNSMPAPVNGDSLSVPAAAANGMGIASSLLPRDVAAQEDFGEFAPDDILKGQNYLNPRALIGYPETIGGALRNANQQIRSEPPNPRDPVSIFNTSTIVPDQMRPAFELGQGTA